VIVAMLNATTRNETSATADVKSVINTGLMAEPPLQHCNSTQTATSPSSLERVNLAILQCCQMV